MTRSFAGLVLDRPLLMGVINVTPDSFSDGGDHATPQAAIDAGRRMLDEGADILDIGGESTRPGATAVAPAEEIRRVAPVIAALAHLAPISIDTRNAATMRAAVEAGAAIVNDVSALTHDPASRGVVALSGAAVVLMHMRGEPGTMQVAPRYDDVVTEVRDFLAVRIKACVAGGIAAHRIAIDPGIGFGKTLEHNLALLRGLNALTALAPVLIGVSRKSFLARLSRGEAAKDRLGGSLAAALFAVARGAAILRVHDVAATRQALAVWRALG